MTYTRFFIILLITAFISGFVGYLVCYKTKKQTLTPPVYVAYTPDSLYQKLKQDSAIIAHLTDSLLKRRPIIILEKQSSDEHFKNYNANNFTFPSWYKKWLSANSIDSTFSK